MSIDLVPGTLCRSRRSGARFLLLEPRERGFDALPYPVEIDAEPAWVPVDELEAVGEDAASARVLLMRRRSRAAAPPRRVAPPRPIRTAMVLCAGLGTRLRPLTLRYPKPAVPFFGGPLVRYSFALLAQAGVSRVVINTHHLPEVMERTAAAEAERLGLELAVSHEPIIQDTAGGIRDAGRFLKGEPFLVLNGDAFMSLDLGDLVARHQARGASATLAVVPMPPGAAFNAIEAEPDGTIRRIRGIGRPGGELRPWHFVGVHVIEPEVLEAIPGPGPRDINGEIYPSLIAAGRTIQACPVELGAWADMGTPQRYLEACEELMSGLCDLSHLGPFSPLAAVSERALREAGPGRSVVDAAARVAPDASLELAQVGPEVEVGAGARLRRCALLPGTRVAPVAIVEDALVSGDLSMAARQQGPAGSAPGCNRPVAEV